MDKNYSKDQILKSVPEVRCSGILVNGPERVWLKNNFVTVEEYERVEREGNLPERSKLPILRYELGWLPLDGEDGNFKISKWIY